MNWEINCEPTPEDPDPRPARKELLWVGLGVIIILIACCSTSCAPHGSTTTTSGNTVNITVNILTP